MPTAPADPAWRMKRAINVLHRGERALVYLALNIAAKLSKQDREDMATCLETCSRELALFANELRYRTLAPRLEYPSFVLVDYDWHTFRSSQPSTARLKKALTALHRMTDRPEARASGVVRIAEAVAKKLQLHECSSIVAGDIPQSFVEAHDGAVVLRTVASVVRARTTSQKLLASTWESVLSSTPGTDEAMAERLAAAEIILLEQSPDALDAVSDRWRETIKKARRRYGIPWDMFPH